MNNWDKKCIFGRDIIKFRDLEIKLSDFAFNNENGAIFDLMQEV